VDFGKARLPKSGFDFGSRGFLLNAKYWWDTLRNRRAGIIQVPAAGCRINELVQSRNIAMRVACLILIGSLSGCAWSPKPYANDPLIRTKKALPGDPYAVPPPVVVESPLPPEPPDELRVADGGT
jgi:hypothetical protein